jgi:transposase, IS5 family
VAAHRSDGIELLLQETIRRGDAGRSGQGAKPGADHRRDDGAPKAIAHPWDSRLHHRGREILVSLAKRHGVPLRQAARGSPSGRCGWPAATPAPARCDAAGGRSNACKTDHGAAVRDVRRKLETRPEVAGHFAEALARVARLLTQQCTDQNKLYALHAPEVACIAKGYCRELGLI